MFESLWQQLIALIHQVWYGGLFIASFIENLIPPIPSEVIMPLGGYLASIGKLDVVLVIAVCAVGSTLGNLPYYFLGRLLSQKVLRKFVSTYGKYFFYKVEYLDDLYDVFRKNDTKIVFFGRFMPGARGFIGLPAGSTHMNFWIFFWYTFAGTLVWTTFLVVLGYYLGQKREVIVGYLKQFDHLMLPIIAGGLVLFIARMIWKREKKMN
jgi:membrane protein DedA with SNARE-associated domain